VCVRRDSWNTKLRLAHLARGHGKLAMASGGDRMAANPHIVGRIKKRRIDTGPVADDPLQESGITAIATSHPMLEPPRQNASFPSKW
jgi:hypothetical protein